ncbi:MAG: thiol:disulfide interchange protein DsbA/DsbL [Succinivibrionaceae bacterium]|nr:thiol:disulfide interchange protein DsbA/DsbL [Succinivibrionaceae bacterium]
MKKIFKSLCSVVFMCFVSTAAMAEDEQFKEGEYYSVVAANELSETQEISEFFSFYCGHCYMFRSTFHQLKNEFPDVKFSMIPVQFLGGEMGPMSQRAYAAAKIMGIEDRFSDELFNQIHQQHVTDYNPESLGNIVAYVGGDKAQFLETFDSFVSISQVAAFNAEMDRAGVKGVPTMMVNHKYLILKAEKDQVVPLIRYLLNKDKVPLAKDKQN